MRGPIAWFARNGVEANLLLLVIIVAGLMALPNLPYPQIIHRPLLGGYMGSASSEWVLPVNQRCSR